MILFHCSRPAPSWEYLDNVDFLPLHSAHRPALDWENLSGFYFYIYVMYSIHRLPSMEGENRDQERDGGQVDTVVSSAA